MNLPHVKGLIRRRLLVNYRVDPAVMARQLPAGLEPKLHRGHAIAGICLIRLEQVRPPLVPIPVGWSSENAAHRVAVVAHGDAEAVYVPRRDTDSWLTSLVGGRLFPGHQHRARFTVDDDGCRVHLEMRSTDGVVSVEVAGERSVTLPGHSVFGSVDEASRFFEAGSLGYSATRDPLRYDGLVLETDRWAVNAFHVSTVRSSYFEDHTSFPQGSVTFDHALVMRDLSHAWRSAPAFRSAHAIEETG